jgi:tol-pal system protein YbgF
MRLSTRAARRARLAPGLFALLACGGCFATRNDVRVLQADIATLRAERAYGDSARAAQIDRIIGQLSLTSDTLRSLATQSNRFQGDAREGLREMREAISQVQEVTTQLQRRLQEVRAAVEASHEPTTPVPGDTTAAAAAPGPNQLYQLALDQYQRGSFATARAGFEDLLKRYPTADVAADAQYYDAESFAAEKNTAAADSTYAELVTRYPQSPRAASALYKRARLKQSAGRTSEARALYQELRKKYPRSDEADLACGAMAGVCPKR